MEKGEGYTPAEKGFMFFVGVCLVLCVVVLIIVLTGTIELIQKK